MTANTKRFFLIATAILVCICSNGENYRTISFTPDTVTVLRNPLNGWVLYLARNWDENFWTDKGYDSMPTNDGRKVKVSDYASTAYIRTSWRALEPEEGKYVWQNPDARLTKLLRSVMDRGLRLAFRIVVDGRDQGQNTPMYVFDAGAEGFRHNVGKREVLTPYPDDPVFQAKYSAFIEAFAKEFNDPDKVDFIDAYGLGKWGEAHSMDYKDGANKIPVFEWITDLYARTFTKIPLIINYHRVLAEETVNGWNDLPSPDSEPMLESAIGKGYSLRHDAFGMTGYYKEWEKEFAAKWNFKRPIIMEGGWIVGAHHRYWIDPCGKYRKDHPEDVRQMEYLLSAEAHVNMMDLRAGNETASWFQCFDLVERFTREGGYRLYPDKVSVPSSAKVNDIVTISHSWKNMGWGYCPVNIPQWNQRYKVCFALLDKKANVVKTFVDSAADLSHWLKGSSYKYDLELNLDGVAPGKYTWAVALVDVNTVKPAIEIAIDKKCQINGWTKISDLKIK